MDLSTKPNSISSSTTSDPTSASSTSAAASAATSFFLYSLSSLSSRFSSPSTAVRKPPSSFSNTVKPKSHPIDSLEWSPTSSSSRSSPTETASSPSFPSLSWICFPLLFLQRTWTVSTVLFNALLLNTTNRNKLSGSKSFSFWNTSKSSSLPLDSYPSPLEKSNLKCGSALPNLNESNHRSKKQFVSRSSLFEFDPPQPHHVSFFGFVHLFWVFVALYSIHLLWPSLHSFFSTFNPSDNPASSFRTFHTSLFLHSSLATSWLPLSQVLTNGLGLFFLLDGLMITSCIFFFLIRTGFVCTFVLPSWLFEIVFFLGWSGIIWVTHAQFTWFHVIILTLHLIVLSFKFHSFSSTFPSLSSLSSVSSTFPSTQPFPSLTINLPSSVFFSMFSTFNGDPQKVSTFSLASFFLNYLFTPTLIYDSHIPRTSRRRWNYIFKKTLLALMVASFLYILLDGQICPLLQIWHRSTSLSIKAWTFLQLIFPFLLTLLLFFYFMFECLCNIMAELTRFADRHFYDDWWNSCTFDQFARRWNKPVHEFLFRHVYLVSMHRFHRSRFHAQVITFFISSVFHEYVFFMVNQHCSGYMFFLQMLQIPLIQLNDIPPWSFPSFGNVFFWCSLGIGLPLLTILYTA